MAANSLSDLQLIWNSLTSDIRENGDITESAFNLWFANVKLVSLTSDEAVFSVENSFKMGIIKDKYSALLKSRLSELIGYQPEIKFVLNPADAPVVVGREPFFKYEIGENGETIVKMPDLSKNDDEEKDIEENDEPSFFHTKEENSFGERRLSYNPDYTFENFVVGKSNEFAHAAALAVAKKPASDYNPLLIYGPSGLGKTHLMYAITNRILESKPDMNIVYVKGEEFTNQLIESISQKSTQEFREKYRKADILLIDDVQFIAGKVSTQEEFFHTFNALYEDHKQIILTSDRPPRDMSTLEDRIKSRFESGLLADIQPPDFELRLAILCNKAEQVNLDVSMDILNYLAENLHDNVRKIEGVIKRLSAKALLTGAPITMEMAKEQIPTYIPPQQSQQEIAKRIMIATARKYGVTMEDILGQKRTKDIKTARNISMFIIRRMTSFSLTEIGKLMNRDHATVYSNISAIEEDVKTNSYLDTEINDIIADVKQ